MAFYAFNVAHTKNPSITSMFTQEINFGEDVILKDYVPQIERIMEVKVKNIYRLSQDVYEKNQISIMACLHSLSFEYAEYKKEQRKIKIVQFIQKLRAMILAQ